jgi:hypothetical protein
VFREITGLESVRKGEPGHHGRGTSPAQKLGLRYERKVESALCAIVRDLGQSAKMEFQVPLHFHDAIGPGLAIADFILTYDEVVIVGEIKYTWTTEGNDKLVKLYIPLAMHLYSTPRVHGLIIARSLVPDTQHCTSIISKLSYAFENRPDTVLTLPWRGQRAITW